MWCWERADARSERKERFLRGRPYENPETAREYFESRLKEIGDSFEQLVNAPYDLSPTARHTRTADEGEGVPVH